MDGVWSAGSREKLSQAAFTRHRLLTVNTSGVREAEDASAFASSDPNTIAPGTLTTPSNGPQGGPHFIMSGNTSDGAKPTYGFEFCLCDPTQLGTTTPAAPGVGGFDVTVWCLMENTQNAAGPAAPIWGSLLPITGVAFNELFHSFDVNTAAIRFQFGNILSDGSITIAMAEL